MLIHKNRITFYFRCLMQLFKIPKVRPNSQGALIEDRLIRLRNEWYEKNRLAPALAKSIPPSKIRRSNV
jgi:hypothetical protein